MANSSVYDSPLTPEERLTEVWRDRKVLVSQPAVWTEDTVGRRGPPMPRAARGWQDGTAPEPTTYYAQAGLDDDDLGGRYAPRRGPDPMPQQPPHSPWWSCDPVGIEPPLGERVDAIPDVTTVSGEDQRGLTPWQYGPTPTEEHSAYLSDTLGVRPSSEVCSLASETAEGSPQIISAVAEPSAVPIKETELRSVVASGIRRF
jgi:hypothetical protein